MPIRLIIVTQCQFFMLCFLLHIFAQLAVIDYDSVRLCYTIPSAVMVRSIFIDSIQSKISAPQPPSRWCFRCSEHYLKWNQHRLFFSIRFVFPLISRPLLLLFVFVPSFIYLFFLIVRDNFVPMHNILFCIDGFPWNLYDLMCFFCLFVYVFFHYFFFFLSRELF